MVCDPPLSRHLSKRNLFEATRAEHKFTSITSPERASLLVSRRELETMTALVSGIPGGWIRLTALITSPMANEAYNEGAECNPTSYPSQNSKTKP